MKNAFVAGCCAALVLALAPSSSHAGGPTGGVVVGGDPVATISGQGSSLTTVNQSANQAIINWQQFSIGAGDTVKFVQPSANAIALNRVLGGDLTQIYGTLQANGRVIVINPNGIMVGSGGMVDTKGFIASTLDVPDNMFLSGGPMLFSGQSTAAVKNQGTIRALGGDVFLIAHAVENSGNIIAPQGTVGLAAGSQVELVPSGDERISVLAGNSSSPTAIGVNNSGAIAAASAELKAAGGNIYALAINNGGVVRATGIVNENGRIYLRADGGNIQNSGTLAAQNADGSGGTIVMDGGHNAANPSTVINSGTIDASGILGGTVEILGDNVGLFDNALVNVSGQSGGGTALIGGDLHGANPDIQNAEHTFISPDAVIKADALDQGNGGEIVVWSDDVTRDFGSISATGGAASGNGGFSEVSSKGVLDFDGAVNLTALAGNGGTLLLDPINITISTAAAANITGFTPPTDNTEAFADDAAVSSTFQLTGVPGTSSFGGVGNGATIVLQAQNNITVANAFNIATETGNNNVSLDLQAGNNININAAVTASGTGTISLSANNNGGGTASGAGTVNFGVNGSLTTANQPITISGTAINLGGLGVSAGNGIISLDATSAGVNQTTGTLSSGGLLLQGAGTFNLANSANSVGTIAASVNGALTYEDANALTVGTVLAVNGIVSGGNAINISTADAPLTVSKNVSAGVDTVALTAGSTGGANNLLTISPGVTVSGATGVTLAGDNMTIDPTAAINAGGSTVFLAQDQNGTLINLGGANGAGTLGLSQSELNTVTAATLQIGNANSGALAITTSITAPAAAGTLSLQSGSTITQNTSAILNVTGPDGLNLKSGGAITLNEANQVANLGITGVGGTVQFTDAQNLTLGGINVPGQTLTLNTSGGAFTLGESGFVNAALLNLNTWGLTTLTQPNQVAALTVNSATSAAFQFTTAAPTLDIRGIAANGQTVTLNGSGVPTVTESTGIINASQLNLNNLGTTTLNQANAVGTLTGTGLAGTLQFTDAQNLSVQGLSGPGQTVTLTGSGSPTLGQSVNPMLLGRLNLNNWGSTGLTLANNAIGNFSASGMTGPIQLNDANDLDVLGIGAPNQTITLAANGTHNLTETAGTITAGTLNVNGWNRATLNQANQVGVLAASSPGSDVFQFTIGSGTTVVEGILDIGQIVTLSGIGAGSVLNESVAPIVGSELDLNNLGPTTLNQANPIPTLKITSAAGTTQFTGAENLTIGGIGASGQTVVLNGGGNNLGQTGVITAGELDLDNWAFTTLGQANQVGVLKVIGGSAQLTFNTGSGNLDIQGISDPGQNVLLTGVGAGSMLTETAGVINAGVLNLTSFGTTTLNQANQVGTLTVAGAAGALQFTDGTSFNVQNIAAGGQAVTLAATGDNNELTVIGGDNVSGSSVTLVGDRINISGTVTTPGTATIEESTSGRQITIGTDDVSAPTASGGTLGLTVAELSSISAGTLHVGDANAGNVTVTAPIAPATFTTLSLQSGAAINENPGASITIGNLAARAASGINLTSANSVGTLAALTPGLLQFDNAGSLTIGNADGLVGIQAGGGAAVTAQSGTLTVSSSIAGPGGITLTANDMAINATVNSGVANTIFQPFTTGLSANFGSPIAGDLNLTQTELNQVTANVLQIGNNLSGAPANANLVVAPLTVHQLLILGGNSSITILSQQLAALSAVETPAPTEQIAQFSSASLSLDEASKILPAGAIGTIWLQLPFPHETTRTYKVEDISKWTSGPMAAVGSTAGPQTAR